MEAEADALGQRVTAFASTLSPGQREEFAEVLQALSSALGPDDDVEGFTLTFSQLTDVQRYIHDLSLGIIKNLR